MKRSGSNGTGDPGCAHSRVVAVAVWVVLGVAAALQATAQELGEVALRQALLDIGTDLRLMCVAAHPDDEDGATLAMYRMAYGLYTVSVIATRGEGGQNEIGPELYNDLAVIRTRETASAARIQGAALRFLDLPDFGFSKSAEETFEHWGHEETVRRLVRAIRQERPDIIISHHGTQRDHGNHQAIGQALREAFGAAADPAAFPELSSEGLQPWRTTRLYLRDWSSPPRDDSVAVPVGDLNAARGRTYAEVAAEALEQHRSQGMSVFAERYLSGYPSIRYLLVRDVPQQGLALTHVPAPPGALLANLRDRVQREDRRLSRREAPRADLERALLKHASEASRRDDGTPEARRRHERADAAAAIALELRLEARPLDALCVPGQELRVAADVRDFGDRDVDALTVRLEPRSWSGLGQVAATPVTMEDGRGAVELQAGLAPETPQDVPAAAHVFDGHFAEPRGDVVAVVRTRGAEVALKAPVAVEVAPPIEVSFLRSPALLRAGADHAAALEVRAANHTPGPWQGALRLESPAGLALSPESVTLAFAGEDEERVARVRVTPVAVRPAPGDYVVAACLPDAGARAEGLVRIVDLEVPEARVGVIRSYDDTFVRTLETLKVPHALIGPADFTPEILSGFTAVIVDIRAYLARPDLVANNTALLDYVRRGGVALVMYQKTLEWRPEFAPYPLHVSANRVTREDAPVRVLQPRHPLFNTPNVIAGPDWEGWIQERGLYFPDTWDPHYVPLVACSDPGEDLPPGGCLVASCGRGLYLYSALGWYRQLRELHPGALRVFANMLALRGEAG